MIWQMTLKSKYKTLCENLSLIFFFYTSSLLNWLATLFSHFLSEFCLHFQKKAMKVFSPKLIFRNRYAESTGLEMVWYCASHIFRTCTDIRPLCWVSLCSVIPMFLATLTLLVYKDIQTFFEISKKHTHTHTKEQYG